MESEFVALAVAGKEAKWLRNLIFEILLWSKPIAPISICCNSAATLANDYSQMYNGKSRHLGVRHSMIRELFMNGVVSTEFVKSQQNLADRLTKGLARDLVLTFAKMMGTWRDFYPDNDDYDPYDDDMYENHDLSEHLQSICDDLDITVRSRKKK
ncbi:hypothetical protein Tco_1174386 [Tanacetum coccineum]